MREDGRCGFSVFFRYPHWLAPESSWGAEMGDVHQIVAYLLLGAAGLHVLGALYHQFVLRDALLSRMLPMRR